MKLNTLLWIGAALVTVPFASGCGYDCTDLGCFAGVEVALVPSVSSTYDVELVLDGVVDAFTCIKTEDGWSVGDSPEGVLWFGCDGSGFRLDATPETLGISVAAQDGSWTGSISESPDYRFYQPNGAKCDGAYGCDQAELTVASQASMIRRSRAMNGAWGSRDGLALLAHRAHVEGPIVRY